MFINRNIVENAPSQSELAKSFGNATTVTHIRELQDKHEDMLQYIQDRRSTYRGKQFVYKKIEGKSTKTKNEAFYFFSFKEFYAWYEKFDLIGTCCYCGVHKDFLDVPVIKNIFDKSKRRRGQVLEIERVVTFPEAANVYSTDNCRLSCYICNNAKSDFLTTKNFKHIALGINKFWESKVGEKIPFPTEIYDTFPN